MKELPLEFTHNDDESPVNLDEKQLSELSESLKQVMQCSGFLLQAAKDGNLTKSFQETLMQSIDMNLQRAGKVVDYQTTFAKEQEKTLSQLRNANIQNHELRMQLGQKVTLEDCRERMKLIVKGFRYWNRYYGFGDYAQDVHFNNYGGIECNLYLEGRSNEEARKRMEEYGIVYGSPKGDFPHPLMTASNMELINKFFASYCPDMYSSRAEIWSCDDTPYIRYVELSCCTLDWLQPYIDESIEKEKKYLKEKRMK